MKYKKRNNYQESDREGIKNERQFVNSANKEKGKADIKNFNIRFSPEELEKLRGEAWENRRSMQQQLKHIIHQYFEGRKTQLT